MTVVTPDFIKDILSNGRLTEAQTRARNGTAHPKNQPHWDQFTSWALICEEVLDTDHNADWYDGIITELSRRGFGYEQIDRMRVFAWQTAGWLNYDKMLWEWCSLDEADMRTALDWQLKEGLISPTQHAERLSYIEHPSRIPAVTIPGQAPWLH